MWFLVVRGTITYESLVVAADGEDAAYDAAFAQEQSAWAGLSTSGGGYTDAMLRLEGRPYRDMQEVLLDPATGQKPGLATLASDIRAICSFLHEINAQELDGWREAAYQRLERRYGTLVEELDACENVDQYVKVSNAIVRVIEMQAKVQGVLSERHLHVDVKNESYVMYQFNDKTPPPPSSLPEQETSLSPPTVEVQGHVVTGKDVVAEQRLPPGPGQS